MTKFLVGATLLAAIACAIASCTTKDAGPTYLDRATVLDPETCKSCHADHFKQWSGSMHAYAADDPVFLAMNKRGQRETNGALGSFCVNCHAPMAVREGATTDGLNLATVPAKLKGVTCFFCHSTDSVTDTHNGALVLSNDLVMRGSFKDPVANTAHRAGYSPLHDRDRIESAQLCGTCHDIVNGHGVALERTFAEWQKTVFAKAPGGATCGQCHMVQSATLQPIAQAPGVFARRAHAHGFPGVDVALAPFPEADDQKKQVQSFLDATLQSALCVAPLGGGVSSLRVILDNVAAGHSWPSGASQDRRAWVELVAYQGANVIYQSGVVADGSPITKLTDPDLWLFRDCMFDDANKEVHMFWQASSTDGSALPGQATFDPMDPRFYQTHIVQSWPRGNGTIMGVPDRVTMRVRLQPMGLDVLDDLVASGDLDVGVRNAMSTWQVGAALEWTPATATDKYFEDRTQLSCVTTTNLSVQADKVPATQPTKCKP